MTLNANKAARRKQIAKRVATYTAAATAATTIADAANAGIVYNDIPDTVISETTPGLGVIGGFDLDDNGTVDFEFGQQLITPTLGGTIAATGANLSLFPSVTPNKIAATNVGSFFYLQNIAAGTTIDGSLSTLSSLGAFKQGYLAYGAAADCPNCEFTATSTGILGVAFDSGGTTNYGWIRAKIDSADAARLTVLDYAYNDMGGAINAGQVPEPGCLGLLALGGAGLLAWRRRRDAVVS